MSKLIDSIREDMRRRGYSLRTEKTYLTWIRRYIRFTNLQHPATTGRTEVSAFLTYLAVQQNMSVNTQKLALNALVYLYDKVLNVPLGELGFALAKKVRHLPTVLSPCEVQKVLSHLSGRNHV